jgi:hypothetical protein
MRALTRTAGLLTVILAVPLPTTVRDLGLDPERAGVGAPPERPGVPERHDAVAAGLADRPRSLRALRPFRSPGPSLDIRLRLRTLVMAGLAVLAASAATPWSTPAQAAPRPRCEGARPCAGPPPPASPPPASLLLETLGP